LTTGTGLVRLVTPEVKDFTSPRTLLEKPWTPVTTEAANVAPGRLVRPAEEDGMERDGPEPDETDPVETGR
jgi:hypothetical protein